MDKVKLIEDRVYVDLDTLLSYINRVADDMSTVAVMTNNPELGNQVLGITFLAAALENVLTSHKP